MLSGFSSFHYHIFDHLEVLFKEDMSSPLLNLLDLVSQEKQLFSGAKSWDAYFAQVLFRQSGKGLQVHLMSEKQVSVFCQSIFGKYSWQIVSS